MEAWPDKTNWLNRHRVQIQSSANKPINAHWEEALTVKAGSPRMTLPATCYSPLAWRFHAEDANYIFWAQNIYFTHNSVCFLLFWYIFFSVDALKSNLFQWLKLKPILFSKTLVGMDSFPAAALQGPDSLQALCGCCDLYIRADVPASELVFKFLNLLLSFQHTIIRQTQQTVTSSIKQSKCPSNPSVLCPLCLSVL